MVSVGRVPGGWLRWGSVLVGLALVCSVFPPGGLLGGSVGLAQEPDEGLCDVGGVEQFPDVDADGYGAAYLLCMRTLGLSQGRNDGGFGPDRELNRGQMASFLVRLWRDTLGNGCPEGSSPFTDISGSTHEANIECLYALGVTEGVSATTYGPRKPLKGSQITRFLLALRGNTHTCRVLLGLGVRPRWNR